MTIIEYILVLEGLVLLVAAIFWAIGETIGRNNPNDGMKLAMRRFWQELMRRGVGAEPLMETGPSDVEQELERLTVKQQKKAAAQSVNMTATLNVKVVPGASRNQIAGRLGDDVKVQVTAPPEGGEANKAVIDLLAECLEIHSYRIKLIRGHYQPRKSFQISGLTIDEVNEKLEKFF